MLCDSTSEEENESGVAGRCRSEDATFRLLPALAGASLISGATPRGSILGICLRCRQVGGRGVSGRGRVACRRQAGGPTAGAVGMFPGLGLGATAVPVGPR